MLISLMQKRKDEFEMYDDPYESGKPKYHNASDIYEALQVMSAGEEIGILSEIFSDVSWEGQDYYYVDNGGKLVGRWEDVTDCGYKMWQMDVAVWQLTDDDANDWIYEILCNDDLAKRVGFKKLFVDNVLNGIGISNQYNSVSEAFTEELQELDRFGYYENCKALSAALPSIGWQIILDSYRNLTSSVYDKLKGLRLDKERQLIVESRAMLTGYDDFMFGLRANQFLHEEQERTYNRRVAELQSAYQDRLKLLFTVAEKLGMLPALTAELQQLESKVSPMLIVESNE